MPITADRKKLYPANWKQISELVRELAGWACEICDAVDGNPHPVTGSKVVLTVHHLDYSPANNHPINLIALCQRCHIRLDRKFKVWRRTGKFLKPNWKKILAAKKLRREGKS